MALTKPQRGSERPTGLLQTMAWLDPVTAINYGYALHASDDQELKDTNEGATAQMLADKFRNLSAEPGTPDESYLTQVQLVILSHARGITRRKKIQIQELRDAKVESDERLGRIQSRGLTTWLNVLYTRGGMMIFATVFMGAIGYLMAQTIGPFLVEYLPDDSKAGGPPSKLAAVFFAGVGKYLSTRWSDLTQNRIVEMYDRRVFEARTVYEQGKLDEIRIHREKLMFLWKEYMGTDYPETASYALVIAGDLRTQIRVHQHRVDSGRSLPAVMYNKAKEVIWRKKKITVEVEETRAL